MTKYYTVNGRTFALRKDGVLAFVLTDHLGGTSKVLDQSGAVVFSQRYWPYGATRSSTGTTPTELLYTGQRERGKGQASDSISLMRSSSVKSADTMPEMVTVIPSCSNCAVLRFGFSGGTA